MRGVDLVPAGTWVLSLRGITAFALQPQPQPQPLPSCQMASDDTSSQLYNKPEHRHILVGNWQEEQKLLETTGTHRYKVCPVARDVERQ